MKRIPLLVLFVALATVAFGKDERVFQYPDARKDDEVAKDEQHDQGRHPGAHAGQPEPADDDAEPGEEPAWATWPSSGHCMRYGIDGPPGNDADIADRYRDRQIRQADRLQPAVDHVPRALGHPWQALGKEA